MEFNKMIKAYEVAKDKVDPDWENEVYMNTINVNDDQEKIYIEESIEFLTELELCEMGVYDNINHNNPRLSDEGIMHLCEELVDIILAVGLISHKYNISNDKKSTGCIITINDIRYHLYEGIKSTTKKMRQKLDDENYKNQMIITFQYIAEMIDFIKNHYDITDEMVNKMKNVKLRRIEQWYTK